MAHTYGVASLSRKLLRWQARRETAGRTVEKREAAGAIPSDHGQITILNRERRQILSQ